jgi:hypothetical protein
MKRQSEIRIYECYGRCDERLRDKDEGSTIYSVRRTSLGGSATDHGWIVQTELLKLEKRFVHY